MYFNDVELFDIKKYIKNTDNIYAHTGGREKEKLEEHMSLAFKYFIEVSGEKNLQSIFENFKRLFLKDKSDRVVEFWKELICNTIFMHDVGKINGDFQHRVMGNDLYKKIPQIDTGHSFLSSCIYFNYYFNKIGEFKGEDLNLLLVFLILNSYIISKHHSSLDDRMFDDNKFKEGVDSWVKKAELYKNYLGKLNINNTKGIFRLFRNVLKEEEVKNKWRSIDFYIYVRTLFSILVACDFYSTSEYKTGKEVAEFGTIKDINRYYNAFKENGVYKGINQYKSYLKGEDKNPYDMGDINELRTQMFIEAETNMVKNIDKCIFYLEAPTGSGKTLTSINLAFRMLEENKLLNKVFYIFPFNTLVEQTRKSLNDIFEKNDDIRRDIAIINSITPIKIADGNKISNDDMEIDSTDYKKSLLNRQFLHYPIVLTTHVNLFNILFGTSREEIFPLVHLSNSVIVLDEIQSYRNSIWKEISIFLRKYAELLNIKVIIMSATLPKLDELCETNEGFVDLIVNRSKYFENPLFKDRVEVDFSLLNLQEDTRDKVLKKIIEVSSGTVGNVLVEFIKKKRALEFYKELVNINSKNKLGKTILLITGDDNKVERKCIIDRVNKEKNIILIATQVIEAGVDIDMDFGFKDISILDSEEQFLGRINRSCRKSGCIVYFFNLDEAETIYKKDFRKEKDVILISEEIQEVLKSKDFTNFYRVIMGRIDEYLKGHTEKNIDKFREEDILRLQFKEIKKRLRLIDDNKNEYTIFFNREIRISEGEILSGEKVWEEYKKLLTDSSMDYAEKKIKLSIVNEKLDYFLYRVNVFPGSYSDILGDIYYLEDGGKYFIDGKFDREKYDKGQGRNFI